MNLRLAIPLLVAAGILQTTLLPHLVLLNVKPDLVLLLVVTWGTIRGPYEGIGWGLVGGMVLDLLGTTPFGTATIAMVAVAFLTSIGEFNLVRSTLLLPIILMFGGTMAFYGIFLLIMQASGAVVEWATVVHSTLVPASVVNTFCTPFIYWFARWLSEQLRPARNLGY